MLFLGVLLALSLATALSVAVSAAIQARELARQAETILAARDPFDEIVAHLVADDPSFGRRAA